MHIFLGFCPLQDTSYSHPSFQDSPRLLEALFLFLLNPLHAKDFNANMIATGGTSQQRSHVDPPDSRVSLLTSIWVSVSSSTRVPEFSTTWSAKASFSAMGSWEWSREEASSRVDPSRFISRWSCNSADLEGDSSGSVGYGLGKTTARGTHAYTTTTFPTHFQIPVSINNGTSTTQTFSPLIHAFTTPQIIALLTAGCTIPFSRFLLRSSLKITLPSFFLSRYPSGWRISSPNVLTMAA